MEPTMEVRLRGRKWHEYRLDLGRNGWEWINPDDLGQLADRDRLPLHAVRIRCHVGGSGIPVRVKDSFVDPAWNSDTLIQKRDTLAFIDFA